MRGLGVVLSIVAALAIASSAEARREYTIQPGDTPDGLRLKFAPTLEELKRANPQINFSLLQVGKDIVDPHPEQSDIEASLREIVDLKAKLADVTSERDNLKSGLSRAEVHTSELEARVAKIAPQAATARYYQDQFNWWVGVLGVVLAIALAITWLQVRARGRLDHKILETQKELAAERSETANMLAQRDRLAVSPPLPPATEKVTAISSGRTVTRR